MQYRRFGKTGTYISTLAFGAGLFGKGALGGATDQADADRMVGMSLDAGVNLFDTADVYGNGYSEGILAQALGKRRRDVLVSSKVHARTGVGPNDAGQGRVHILRSLEDSLRALKTDWIDIYQVHHFDPLTEFEETLSTLSDVVRQGKVRYIGCSNFQAWQIMKASKVAALNGLEEFASVQAYYSVVGRDIERELVPLLQDQNMALLAYSVLGGAFLTGRFSRDQSAPAGTRRHQFNFPPVDPERGFQALDAVTAVAKRHNRPVPQIALAWALHQPAVTSVILGARTVEQLQGTLPSAGVTLTEQDLKEIDAASRLTPEYPAWIKTISHPRHPMTEDETQKFLNAWGTEVRR